jgi:hypothetical protein
LTNEQFVVNPLFVASIGYKMKKLVLKPDAEPIFSSSKLADKEVSAEEREKSSCSKTNILI